VAHNSTAAITISCDAVVEWPSGRAGGYYHTTTTRISIHAVGDVEEGHIVHRRILNQYKIR